MQSILKTYLARLCLALITFTTNVIIARKLGAEGVGEYALYLASGMLLAQILSFGLESALLFYSSRQDRNPSSLLLFSLLYSIIISVAALFLCYVLTLFELVNGQYGYLICAVLFIQVLQSLVIAVKTGEGKLLTVNKYLIVCHLCLLLVIYFILSSETMSARSMLYAYLTTSLMVVVMLALGSLKSVSFLPKHLMGDIFHYGIRSYLSSVSSIIRIRSQIIILSVFAIPTSVGLYSVAQSFTEALYILPVVLSSYTIAMLGKLDRHQKEHRFTQFAKLSFYTGILMFLGIQLCAPYFIPLLYGESFFGAVDILLLLSFSIIFYSLNKIFTAFLFAIDKPELCSKAETVVMIAGLICTLLLASIYGATGVAISVVLSSILLSLILLFFIKQNSSIQIKDILKVSHDEVLQVVHELKLLRVR